MHRVSACSFRSRAALATVLVVSVLFAATPAKAREPADNSGPQHTVGFDNIYVFTVARCGEVWAYVQPFSPTAAEFVSHLPMTVFISEPSIGLARRQLTVLNPGSPLLLTGAASPVLFNSTPNGRGPGLLFEFEWNGGSNRIQSDPYFDNCYGAFVPTLPTRVLDTRSGAGRAAPGPVAPGSITEVDVSGAIQNPGVVVTAAVLNITATSPITAGYVSAYPCGQDPPTASNLNFAAAETVPNLVIVDLVGRSAPGKVCLFSSTGTDLLADITGYFVDWDPPAPSAGALFKGLDLPQRVIDTRASVAVAAGSTLRVPTAGVAGIPATGVSAISMNVTATQGATNGYLTVFPCDTDVPNASNVNFSAGQSRPNAAIVGTGTNGDVCIYASTTTHVIIDVVGYFGGATDGVPYWPHAPIRRWDSRITPFYTETTVRKLPARTWFTYAANGYTPGDVLNFNITVTDAVTAGFVSVYPCAQGVPASSNLNFAADQTVANTVQVRVDQNGWVCLYTSATINFIMDQSGSFFVDR